MQMRQTCRRSEFTPPAWPETCASVHEVSQIKVVVIGVGSHVFGVGFLQDYFGAAALASSELWLVDVDRHALDRMHRLAMRFNQATDHEVELHVAEDADEALPGAEFVVTSVAVDRDRTWQFDHQLALECGFPSVLSENAGPGGLSHTLRSIPLVLDLARRIERHAPESLVINYTNPENRVALALMRYTNLRFIGLCHGVASTTKWIADGLGVPLGDISVTAAGVNHLTWVLDVSDRRTGRDLSSDLALLVRQRGPAKMPLAVLLYETFGCLPTTGDNHVGEFIPWAAEVIGTDGYDFDGFASKRTLALEMVQAVADGTQSPEQLIREGSNEARVAHSGAELIADIVSGATRNRPSFIVPNNGYISGIPKDVPVEVPGLIDGGNPTGVPVGALPPPIHAMVSRELNIQSLAVDAAATGDPDLALQALLLDPCVSSVRQARRFLETILDVHRDHLPAFGGRPLNFGTTEQDPSIL